MSSASATRHLQNSRIYQAVIENDITKLQATDSLQREEFGIARPSSDEIQRAYLNSLTAGLRLDAHQIANNLESVALVAQRRHNLLHRIQRRTDIRISLNTAAVVKTNDAAG